MTLQDILRSHAAQLDQAEDEGSAPVLDDDDENGGAPSTGPNAPPPQGPPPNVPQGPPPSTPALAPRPMGPPPPNPNNAPVIAPDGNHPGFLGHVRDILNHQSGGLFTDQTVQTPNGPQVVRTATPTGSWMSAIGNIVRPAIAGAAHQNIAGGGPKDWFAAAQAGANANQAHADKVKKDADDARAKQIEDFEIGRQTTGDARLQGAADTLAAKNAATEKETAARDQQTADAKSDANYLKATTDGGAKAADPTLVPFLEGKAAPGYQTPAGFNRASYDKIGGRWVQLPDTSPKAAAQKATVTAALAKSGYKLDTDGSAIPMSPTELSAMANSTNAKNTAQANNATAQAGLATKRTASEDTAMNIRAQMAATALRNAATNEQRLALAKDQFNLNYTGQTADGSIVLQDPDTGQVIVPKVNANLQKLPALAQQKIAQSGAVIDAGARLKQMADQLSASGEMGEVAGTMPQLEAKLGTASPAVKAFIMQLKSTAALAGTVHGTRGVALINDIENALGSIRQNPEGFKAAVNALQDTSNDVINNYSIIHRPGVPSSRPLNQPPAAVPPANQKPAVPAAQPMAHDAPPPSPQNFGGLAGYAMRDPVSGAVVNKKADRAKKYEAQGWKYVY